MERRREKPAAHDRESTSTAPLRGSRRELVLAFLVFLVAATLLSWNLGARYLWQDEAATAVLAQRLFRLGKPLAYDGRNLITMDRHVQEEATFLEKADPEEVVRFYAEKGDYKDDTTWIGQPWGQFVVAGASLAVLGSETVPARLPFALAGALTAVALFRLARRRFTDPVTAYLGVALLLGNTFWYLHMRQCRYYALSTLFLVLTLCAYLRWQARERGGAWLFLGTAWVWFQQDFGVVWPVFGILAIDALIRGWKDRWTETAGVFAGLGILLTPFLFYYELLGRLKISEAPWNQKFLTTLFQLNQFQLPFVILILAVFVIGRNKTSAAGEERRIIGLSLAIIVAEALWMPSVGPAAFYRYIVAMTPLASLIIAYVVVWVVRKMARALTAPRLVPVGVAGLTFVVLATNSASWPFAHLIPERFRLQRYMDTVWRSEWIAYGDDLMGKGIVDPNRAVVELLRPRLKAADEILCNYEDIPLMFYFPGHRIRGGISCFRVHDPSAPPPRFAVIRRSVSFSHTSIYTDEIRRHPWRRIPLRAPEIPWGNSPDPLFHYSLFSEDVPDLLLLELVAGAK